MTIAPALQVATQVCCRLRRLHQTRSVYQQISPKPSEADTSFVDREGDHVNDLFCLPRFQDAIVSQVCWPVAGASGTEPAASVRAEDAEEGTADKVSADLSRLDLCNILVKQLREHDEKGLFVRQCEWVGL